MITISLYGIDPYLARPLSRVMTSKIADVYEINQDEVNFFAHEGLLVHDGVEQNTWNVIVKVNAPLKVQVLEKQIVVLFKEYMKDACVNFSIEFTYYSQDSRYEFINKEFPRFMNEENSFYIDEDEADEDDEENEEPYLGNAFADIEEK